MHIPALFARRRQAALAGLFALLWIVPAGRAQELRPIQLPKPQMSAGMPLMPVSYTHLHQRLLGQLVQRHLGWIGPDHALRLAYFSA